MATVDLIGKGKVMDYITAHPESETAFLTFLKEFEYYPFRHSAQALSGGLIMGTMYPARDYAVEYKINLGLKTACILWLGNSHEYVLHLEEVRKNHVGKIKTVTVTLTPGNNRGHTHAGLIQNAETMDTVYVRTTTDDAIINSIVSGENRSEALNTPADYERSLASVIENFAVKPESPEFKELELLILLIKHYEARHIHFPKLNLPDAIKLKMEQFGLLPDDFVRLIGKKENADLFFSGKRMLAKGILQKLCARVGIRFPITEDDMVFR